MYAVILSSSCLSCCLVVCNVSPILFAIFIHNLNTADLSQYAAIIVDIKMWLGRLLLNISEVGTDAAKTMAHPECHDNRSFSSRPTMNDFL